MFFQIKDRTDEEEHVEQRSEPARIVVAEDGNIIFSNQRFRDLCDFNGSHTHTIQIREVFKLPKNKTISTLTDGLYSVKISNQSSPPEFQFDQIKTANEKVFLVGSEIYPNQPKQDLSPSEMEEFVNRLRLKTIDQVQESLLNISQKKLGSLKENTDLKQFLDMSNDVMIVTDKTGAMIRVNETFCKMFGFRHDQIDTMTFFDIFGEADRPTIRATMQNLMNNEEGISVVDFESRNIGNNGVIQHMEWRQSIRDSQIYCVGRDVTAIKAHEEELIKRESQLSEAEIIGRMGRWHWTIGQDFIDWSDQIYRIFGVGRDEFSPSINSLNQLVHRRDVGRVVQGFQRAIIEQNNYDMEFRITRPCGDIRSIRCEGRCEYDSEGEVIALYGIMQDMTERMLYERELKEAKDAAERAYAAKSQFLANMSHELRTPLNAIIGFSEMMQRQLLGPIGTEKYLDYIGGIHESGQHLLDLISDILDMSKIEAGKHEMDWEEINIVKIIQLAVHMMEGRAQDSNIKLATSEIKDSNINIIADRRAFMQIILNLISNAIKFSKENGKVWLECEKRREYVAIKVCDNGIGIPPNKLHCITQPFEQAVSSYDRPYEGSGLGLAITKELVEMHKGTLLIDSTVDVGTVVTIRLPYNATIK